MLKDSLTKKAEQPSQSQGFTLGPLEVTIEEFQKLKKKRAVFAFRLNEDKSITLDGWDVNLLGQMDDQPDVVFKPTGSAPQPNLLLDSMVYLGINILTDVKDLQEDLITAGAKKVRFVPVIRDNYVTYEVYPVDEGGSQLAALADTNPCPPKRLGV